jgi:WD40 repeat protein
VLTDEQFIDQIRADLHAGVDVLEPSQELLDSLNELTPDNGRAPHGSLERPAARDQRRWPRRVRGLGAAVPVLAAVIVVIAVAAAAWTTLRSSTAVTPGGPKLANSGQIAIFGGWSLEFVNPDGSDLRDVVQAGCDPGTGFDRVTGCFAWSPDGKRFAYLAGGTLYVVGADGQHSRPLTACGDCQGVSLSPDGSQIAVGRYLAGQINVWVVNATTGAMRQITDCPQAGACNHNPSDGFTFPMQWSPDGQEIFFIRPGKKGKGALLGTVRPDGSDQTELKIPGPETAYWSPDGRQLAVDAANGIYIADAAGTVTKLPKLPEQGTIAWSPDSRELAVAVGGDFHATATGIYTIDTDGKALTRLAADRALVPAWSPDGKQLAYSGWPGREGVMGIWTINADGSDRRLIYKNRPYLGGVDSGPSWSPDGRQLAFSYGLTTYVLNADGTGLHRIGPPSGLFAWQPAP